MIIIIRITFYEGSPYLRVDAFCPRCGVHIAHRDHFEVILYDQKGLEHKCQYYCRECLEIYLPKQIAKQA